MDYKIVPKFVCVVLNAKSPQIMPFKWVNCMTCGSYLNKAIKKTKERTGILTHHNEHLEYFQNPNTSAQDFRSI